MRKSQEVGLRYPSGLAPQLARELDQATSREVARGILATTRSQVRGQVARSRLIEAEGTAQLAMGCVFSVSRSEARYSQELPHATGRFQAIADAYALIAVDEVWRMRGDH